jgi:peptidoglycan/xylan/chitin deacetylase (PgdA/CDA1 family)
VRAELGSSSSVIEAALGVRAAHLAYPVGDRSAAGPREFRIATELRFETAVTTRPGVVFPQHAEHLTALPRISLNGNFQRPRYAKVFDLGRRHRIVERLPPSQRDLIDPVNIHRSIGSAGSTQPMPATA